MASEDNAVDVSVLEELIDLRKQQELVDQFCARAEEMKVKVDAAVYERVIADYGARKHALEEQAAPLVVRALAEYRKLREIHQRVQRTHDAAQLDKDEVEFRHSLGEIDEAMRKERLVAPERALAESAAELATLGAQDARFREALPNVDLNAQLAEAAEAPEPRASTDSVSVADSSDAQAPAASSGETISGPASSSGSVASLLAGGLEDSQELTFVEIAPEPQPAEGEPPAVPLDAVLLSEGDNGKAVNFTLGGSTYIGRAEDNQLRILDPGISRRHVLITATPSGYTIRDLKSQNGTYVNGERIDQTPLADGDRITIGEMHLLFKHQTPGVRRQAS